MKSLIILGRQPALGLAELESLYGPKVLKPIFPNGVLVDMPAKEIDFNRLGGSIKLTSVLDVLITTSWRDIAKVLEQRVPEHLQYVPDGKFTLGLSCYGIRVSSRELQQTALSLKKIIKATGRPVRIVPNKAPALSSAQVIHNKLTSENGWELVLFRDGPRTILALTKAEQDIEAYAARDQNRPRRDAKVGMLPPKLAQIIINLAHPERSQKNEIINAWEETYKRPFHILDPFCGTGVVLQEALLMGYNSVLGSDIDFRMVEYSSENIRWIADRMNLKDAIYEIYRGDATSIEWREFEAVACETYLGKPLSKEPNAELLDKIRNECDQIHRGFLSNFAKQAKPGTRLCLAVPAWRVRGGLKHLKTLDYLRELGYTRIEFVHAKRKDLVYYREDQFVARELVVLKKN